MSTPTEFMISTEDDSLSALLDSLRTTREALDESASNLAEALGLLTLVRLGATTAHETMLDLREQGIPAIVVAKREGALFGSSTPSLKVVRGDSTSRETLVS